MKDSRWAFSGMAGSVQKGFMSSMTKMDRFFSSLLSNENRIGQKRWYLRLYKAVFVFMSIDCLFCGLLPSFVSFGRIFYLEDTSFYLVFYLSFLFLFILAFLLFVVLSLRLRVFRRTLHPILIALV